MAWGLFAQQNTEKTVKRNSRINFYFVTSFYRLYDICIVRHEAFIQIRLKTTKALHWVCREKVLDRPNVKPSFYLMVLQLTSPRTQDGACVQFQRHATFPCRAWP